MQRRERNASVFGGSYCVNRRAGVSREKEGPFNTGHVRRLRKKVHATAAAVIRAAFERRAGMGTGGDESGITRHWGKTKPRLACSISSRKSQRLPEGGQVDDKKG